MGSTGAACAPTRDLGAAIVATRLYRAVYNLLKPGIHFLCALVQTGPLWQGMREPSPVLQPEVDDPGGRPRRRCRPRANMTTLHCGDFAVSAMCTRCRRRCVGSPNMDLRSPNTLPIARGVQERFQPCHAEFSSSCADGCLARSTGRPYRGEGSNKTPRSVSFEGFFRRSAKLFPSISRCHESHFRNKRPFPFFCRVGRAEKNWLVATAHE